MTTDLSVISLLINASLPVQIVMVLLLGPIGWLLFAVSRRRRSETPDDQRSNNERSALEQ